MGTIRSLKRSMGQGGPMKKAVCLSKTGLVFEGCKVVLVVDDPIAAKSKSDHFRLFMGQMMSRANTVNMQDVMDVSLVIRDRVEKGKPIWN